MPRTSRLSLALLPLLWACAADPGVRGAWQTETYFLQDGTQHDVEGAIFFTESDWTVLFFVPGEDGDPRRGSAEGGIYTLDGTSLVFTHRYNLSFGHAVPGLPATPLTMRIADGAEAPREPCQMELDGDRLTLRFPSGNSMTFLRSSGF